MSKTTPRYAEVAPAVPLPATGPQTYTYRVPANQTVEQFTQVTIPLGRRQVPGVVVQLHQNKVPYRTKPLVRTKSEAQLTAYQIAFAQWIATTMHGSIGFTLRLFFPPGGAAEADHKIHTSTPSSRSTPPQYMACIDHNTERRHQTIAHQVKQALNGTGQALIIVPEKWQIEPLAAALEQHLATPVARVHSDRTPAQLRELWYAVRHRTASVVVGTQKALFLPYQHLSLVVLEEEFYPTHKLWDAYPRLDNRYAARQVAAIHQADYLQTGSLPSLRLVHDMERQGITVIRNQPLRLKATVAATTFDDRKKRFLLPTAALTTLKLWLKKGERVCILFNRRGTWQVMMCRHCQATIRCPHCEVALTVHQEHKKSQLVCHHCDFATDVPAACPSCGKKELRSFGAGAEKIADILRQHLPHAPLTILDTTALANEAVMKKLTAAKPATGQIILGTAAALQVLPRLAVDRAMFLLPELTMLYPDFRSEEQSLYYAARLQQALPSRRQLVIATRYPQLIERKLVRSFPLLFRNQLQERQRLHYPPYTDMVRLTLTAKTTEAAMQKATNIRRHLDRRAPADVIIRGPYQSFIKKRRARAEVHLLLLGQLDHLTPLYADLPVDSVDLAPQRVL